jgi:enoyl-CoA hydratase
MGVPPTNMWLYHLGPQWTKRLLFTGDTVSGADAASIGLAQAAVPAPELNGYTLSLAARIALVGRDLLVANKRVVNQGVELMGRSQLQRFAALNDAVAHRSPDARAFTVRAGEVGLKQAVHERDVPFEVPVEVPSDASSDAIGGPTPT